MPSLIEGGWARVMSCHVSRTRTVLAVQAIRERRRKRALMLEIHCVKVVADQPYEQRILGNNALSTATPGIGYPAANSKCHSRRCCRRRWRKAKTYYLSLLESTPLQ